MFHSRVFKLFCMFCVFCVGFVTFLPKYYFVAEAGVRGEKLKPTPSQQEFIPDPLPKSGTIAVLVKGASDHHNASVAALVCQRLVAKGYKVVDAGKLAAIRESKAAMAMLNGDVGTIVKLSSQYGVGTMITMSAQSGQSAVNSMGHQTGTASVAVMAVTSGGKIVYSDTVPGKKGGHTPDEAVQKAIEDAALKAVERMTQ